MNLFRLFLDLTNNQLVVSDTNGAGFVLPPFYQGDVVPLELVLLEANPQGGVRKPYLVVNDASLTPRMALVTPHPTAPTVHTFVDLAWNGVDRWQGLLPLNTAGITTLLGGNTSAQCHLEIELTTASGSTSTELQDVVAVKADGIKGGEPTILPGESYVTAAQFRNEAAKQRGLPGESITLTSLDGLASVTLALIKDPVTGEYRLDQNWRLPS